MEREALKEWEHGAKEDMRLNLKMVGANRETSNAHICKSGATEYL